ncbi:hypothetical protein TYRP_011535 [Tyrophagus putrescentiae]|nr:hypothetical protein TYRP_011535 [Tyrophagus putrescentiae]
MRKRTKAARLIRPMGPLNCFLKENRSTLEHLAGGFDQADDHREGEVDEHDHHVLVQREGADEEGVLHLAPDQPAEEGGIEGKGDEEEGEEAAVCGLVDLPQQDSGLGVAPLKEGDHLLQLQVEDGDQRRRGGEVEREDVRQVEEEDGHLAEQADQLQRWPPEEEVEGVVVEQPLGVTELPPDDAQVEEVRRLEEHQTVDCAEGEQCRGIVPLLKTAHQVKVHREVVQTDQWT